MPSISRIAVGVPICVMLTLCLRVEKDRDGSVCLYNRVAGKQVVEVTRQDVFFGKAAGRWRVTLHIINGANSRP
jgi:hypothetical protein